MAYPPTDGEAWWNVRGGAYEELVRNKRWGGTLIFSARPSESYARTYFMVVEKTCKKFCTKFSPTPSYGCAEHNELMFI